MDEAPQTQDDSNPKWLEGLRTLFQASANTEDQLLFAEVEELIQNEQKCLTDLSAKPSLKKLLPPSIDSELTTELDHLLLPRVFGAFLKWLNDDPSMDSESPEPLSRFCALADGISRLPTMLHRDSKRLKGVAKKEETKLLIKVKTIEERTARHQLLLGEDEQHLVPTISAELKGELTTTMSELEEAIAAEEEARKIYEAAVMRTKGLRERAQRIQRASTFVDEQGQTLRQLNSVLIGYDDLSKQQLEGRVRLFNTLLNCAEHKWQQLWTQQIFGAALPQILPRLLQQFTITSPDLSNLIPRDQVELMNRRVVYEALNLCRRTLVNSKYASPDQAALLLQWIDNEVQGLSKDLIASRSVQLPSLLGQGNGVHQYISSTVVLFHPQHHIMHETPPYHVEGVARVMTIIARIQQKVAFRQDDHDDDDALMQLALEDDDNDGSRSLVLLPCADVTAPPQWCLPLVHSPEYLARLQVAAKEAAELDLFVPLEFESEWEDTDDEAEDAMDVATEDDALALEMRRRRGSYGLSTQGSRLKHGDVTDIPAPLLERIGADRLSAVNEALRPSADDIQSAIKLFAPSIDTSKGRRSTSNDDNNGVNSTVDRLKGTVKGTLGKRVKTPYGNGTTVIGAAKLVNEQVVVLMDWGSIAYLQTDQVKSIRGRASRRPKSLPTVDGAPIIGVGNAAANRMKYAPPEATPEQIAAQLANRFSTTDLRLHKLIRRLVAIIRLQRHITTRTNIKDANLSLWMHGRTTAGMSRAIEADIKNWLKRFDRRKLEELIESYEAKPVGSYLENDFLTDMEKVRNLQSRPYDDSFVGPQYADLHTLRQEAMAYAQSRLVTKSGAARAKPYRKSRTPKVYNDDFNSGGGYRAYHQHHQGNNYYDDQVSPRSYMFSSASGDMSPSSSAYMPNDSEWQPQSTTEHVQQIIGQQPMKRHPGKRGMFVPAPPGRYPDHGMRSFQENMRFLFVNLSARLRVSQSFFIQSVLPQYQSSQSNGNTYSQSLLSGWLRYRAAEQSSFEVNSAVLKWCNDYRSSLTPEEVTKLQSAEEFFALASAFAQPFRKTGGGRGGGVRIPRPKQQQQQQYSPRPSLGPMPQHELLLPDISSGFGDVGDDFAGIEEMAVAEDEVKNDQDEDDPDFPTLKDSAFEQEIGGSLDFSGKNPLPKIYTEEMSQELYQAFLTEVNRRELTHAYINNEAERLDISLAQPIISRFVKAGIVPYTGKRHDFCRTLHSWISFSKTKGRATQPTVISAAVDAKALRQGDNTGVAGSLYCSGCGKDSESFARAGQFYEHLATCGRTKVKQESANEEEDDDEDEDENGGYRRTTRGLVQQAQQQRQQRYRKVAAIKPLLPFSRERVMEMEELLAHNVMNVNRDPFNPSFHFAICEICGDKGGDMLACSSCPWRYHPGCLSHADINSQADDRWHCPDCKDRGIADAKPLSDEIKPYALVPAAEFLWFTPQHEWRRVLLVTPHTIFSDHIMLFRVINIETGAEEHESSPQWLDTVMVTLFTIDHLRMNKDPLPASTGFQYRDRLNENDEDDDKDVYSRPYVSRKRKVSFPANDQSDDDDDGQQKKAARRGYGWSPNSPKKRGRKPKQQHLPEEGGDDEQQPDNSGGGLGAGMSDTYISATSVDAAMSSAGIACRAVDIVMQGQNTNAFAVIRPPGHHAGRHGCTKGCLSTGFCLLNNAVLALTYARVVYGLRKVAVVDIDVHYGNGTAELLRGDEVAFFASVHMIHGEHNDGEDPNPHGVEGEVQGFYPPLLGTFEVEDANFVSVGVQPEPGYGPHDPPPKKKRRGRRRRTWVVESEEEEDDEVAAEGDGKAQAEEEEEDEELVSEEDEAAAVGAASSSASSSAAMVVASADEAPTEMIEESVLPEAPLQPQELKGRQGFLTGLEKIILPKLEAFQPELLIISAGFDGYFSDPLGGGLQMTEEDYGQCTQMLMKSMERVATLSGDPARSSRVVSLLEGGYDTAPLTLGLAKCAVAHVLMLNVDSSSSKQDAEQTVYV